MERLLWVCLAGAAGSGARYLISLWAAERLDPGFPYGTLLVNLAGCFSLTVLMHLGAAFAWPPSLRTAITVGFLGGLTTYSAFNYETLRLVQAGSSGQAAANLVLTVAGGLLAGWCGLACARQLVGE